MYFDNYRFSEDLDFVYSKGADLSLLRDKLNALIDGLKISLTGINVTEEKEEKSRLQIMLGYNLVNEIIEGGKHLKLDICEAEDVPGNIAARIRYIHDEFKNADDNLLCYKLEAVAADKINRINSINKEARDIYDMKFILEAEVDINKLKEEYKRRFAYSLNSADLIRKVKDKAYEGLWNSRLGHQVKELPEYKVFIKQLENVIKERFNILDY
ncbi:MAG: nucleotidyl transferase AbiEii/AbiGii toxin family protein [Candidatus Goldbacteria bacterium]|nr:nucleotidyl transferase AbiEii/AbiGii toxin family protein [Candidatus Goldiibacteriota bacterium]